jgi:hypothetical protein
LKYKECIFSLTQLEAAQLSVEKFALHVKEINGGVDSYRNHTMILGEDLKVLKSVILKEEVNNVNLKEQLASKELMLNEKEKNVRSA